MENSLNEILFRTLPSGRIGLSQYGQEIVYLVFKDDIGFYDRWMIRVSYGTNKDVTDDEKTCFLLKMRRNLFRREPRICEEELHLMFDLWGFSLEKAMKAVKKFLVKDSGMTGFE